MKKSYSPFLKNDIIELDITDIGINGEGIAHVNGYTVFVKNAIKGERVKAKVILAKPTYAIAILDKIIKNSDVRVKSKCEYFGKCGGCTMQHINYQDQIEYKNSFVVNAFKKIASIDVKIDETIVSENQYNYRNKLSLPVRQITVNENKNNDKYADKSKKNKANRNRFDSDKPQSNLRVGFFRSGTHDVVDINDCKLQNFECKLLIESLKNYMQENFITGYNEQTGIGEIRHLTIRSLSGKTTVCIVGTKVSGKKYASFANIIEDIFGQNFALFYNQNCDETNVIFGKNFEFIAGKNEPVSVDGLLMNIHPAGFFQINDDIRQKLYKKIDALTASLDSDCIIEAYAGAGVLACKLSKNASKVYAIEVNKESVIAFNNIAKLNDITNVEMIKGDCKVELVKLLNSGNIDKDKTVLVLDPPRAGISKEEADAIDKSGIKTIIYISCSYSSLARDTKNLSENYQVQSLSTFDMFPQTSGIETLCIFTRK